MPVEDPGYGFVDASTPEVFIAVAPDQRGTDMGGALLRGLLDTARSQGFDALGLSVREDNHVAIRLYERSGFLKLSSGEGSWTMKADLADPGGE
jgi:GNAT superfamily N-acetyltransferase